MPRFAPIQAMTTLHRNNSHPVQGEGILPIQFARDMPDSNPALSPLPLISLSYLANK
jgi:hypothetical protein